MNKLLANNQDECAICGKGTTMGNNKPHSIHKTKRIIKPNLQKIQGALICTRCIRTKIKKSSF
jgi:ribosomal protein L28